MRNARSNVVYVQTPNPLVQAACHDKQVCRLLLPEAELDSHIAIVPQTISPIGKRLCKKSHQIRQDCARGCGAACSTQEYSHINATHELMRWEAVAAKKGQSAAAAKEAEMAVIMLKAITTGNAAHAFKMLRAAHHVKTSIPHGKEALKEIESALANKTEEGDDAVVQSAASAEAAAAHKAALQALGHAHAASADVIAAVEAAISRSHGSKGKPPYKPLCHIPKMGSTRGCDGTQLSMEGYWDLSTEKPTVKSERNINKLVCEAVPYCLQHW